jgi:hypothetical protein
MPYAHPTTHQEFPVMYNVEQAVGLNSPNASADVRLVQYMIRHTYGPPAAALAVDGYIGATTVSWINRFQSDVRRAGNNVMVDGRIDRALGYQSSVSKTVYTIILLNMFLKKRNPAAYAAIPQKVPISANPKPNPYNPKPDRKIVRIESYGKVHRVVYADGTVETYHVEGEFNV